MLQALQIPEVVYESQSISLFLWLLLTSIDVPSQSPGIFDSVDGDAPENSTSSYDDRKRGPKPKSPSKRSDDDGSFPTIVELLAGRK